MFCLERELVETFPMYLGCVRTAFKDFLEATSCMGFPTCFYVPNGVAIGQALQANAWRRQWQATPVILPRESQGWQGLVGCRLWGRTESDTTEVT